MKLQSGAITAEISGALMPKSDNAHVIRHFSKFFLEKYALLHGKCKTLIHRSGEYHRVLEGAGQQLPLQINRKKSRAGVDVFVTRYLFLQNISLNSELDICFGSRHDALWIDFFYSLVGRH